MYGRLMPLILVIRQFMLLDIAMFPDGSEEYSEPPYKQLDDLATLHARAMLHMHELGWLAGSLHSIAVGERWVPGKRWFNRGHYVTIYESHFGVSSFAGIIFMRSGAIYGTASVSRLQRDGTYRRTCDLLDLARIDDGTRSYITAGLQQILKLRPEPVYIDN